MTSDASPTRSRWEEATREVASLLDERTCIVLVGERDVDAARVALALGKTHARHRRVAIVDAVGELSPLRAVLPSGAERHGVIDHFENGVSLRKIAQAVNRERSLFIVPSGVGPFDYSTLLRRERWRRLTMAFRTEGALLCIVLPANAEGLVQFVEDTDGVILVGEVDYPESRHVVARVASRTRTISDVLPASPTPPQPEETRATRKAFAPHATMLATAALVLVAASALWIGRGDGAATNETASTTASSMPASAGAAALESADTTGGAFYAIDVVMLSSLADANRQLKERLGALPAATFSPVRLGADSARWYRVLIGAWPRESDADSVLVALRGSGLLQRGFGSVRRTPFAVHVAGDLQPQAALARAAELRAQGLPAYALARDADHAGVYAGAFETPSQAMPLLDMFKRAGIDASVGYRLGRGI